MFDGVQELRTDRLRLRMVSAGDIEPIATLTSDPRVNQHSPTGAPTLAQARDHVRSFVEDWKRDGIGYWVVELDGLIVGIAGIKSITLNGEQWWNLYFRFTPEVWGLGIAREAARAALEVAGELEPGRRVLVRTRPSNDAAIRLTTMIGMTRAPSLDRDGFLVFTS